MTDLIENRPDDKFFISGENADYVINERTGRAYTSVRATHRVLEVALSTLHKHIKVNKYELEMLRIPTNGGFQGVHLISTKLLYTLASQYNPKLAESMLEFGATGYIYREAGYPVIRRYNNKSYVYHYQEKDFMLILNGYNSFMAEKRV